MLLYGHPLLCRRKESWGLVSKVLEDVDLSLLVMGDYNQVMEQSDRSSSSSRGIVGAEWAKNFVDRCGLSDITGFGVHFSWTNNRKGRDVTLERIDRAIANGQWLGKFPSAALFVYPIFRSDHSPLLMDTHWEFRDGNRKRPKRFEERWLHIDEVSQITRRVWNLSIKGSMGFGVVQK